MDIDEIRTSPESQHQRGLSPEEQRAEREQESQEQPVTKYELLSEETARESEAAAELIAEPLEPGDGDDDEYPGPRWNDPSAAHGSFPGGEGNPAVGGEVPAELPPNSSGPTVPAPI